MNSICAGCDQEVSDGEYFVKTLNNIWHYHHFVCWKCDRNLLSENFLGYEDNPYCVPCYNALFPKYCTKCRTKITLPDYKSYSYNGKYWHGHCLRCVVCNEGLSDTTICWNINDSYCKGCYENQFGQRCSNCNEVVTSEESQKILNDKKWHDRCFCCSQCLVPIGNKHFTYENEQILCVSCNSEHVGYCCDKCQEVVYTSLIVYRGQSLHKECFNCHSCEKNLVGECFVDNEQIPYCVQCFNEIFTQSCAACRQQITGEEDIKYVELPDRIFHPECFVCTFCRCDLLRHPVVDTGTRILCRDCFRNQPSTSTGIF